MSTSNTEPYADVPEDASINGLEASFVTVDGTTARVDGVKTRYYEAGNGTPLILLHGGNWGGEASANTWSTVIEGLSDSFRVLAPDRLGCGMTENPENEEDYVYGSEVEHMVSFINSVGVDEFHICGQSRGGGISGRVTAEIPDRVKTFIPINSGTLSPSSGTKDYFYSRVLRDAPSDKEDPAYEAKHYKHRIEGHEYSPHHITDEFANAAGYMIERQKAKKTAEVLEEKGLQDRWKETLEEHMNIVYKRFAMGELQMPILNYWGRNDPSVDISAGIGLYDMMADQNPRVEMHIVNKAGHHPYREYPEAFIDHITSWTNFWEKHGYDYGEPEVTHDY